MFRVQMLDQNESHARVFGQVVQKLGKSFIPARRRANTHDRERDPLPTLLIVDNQFPWLGGERRAAVPVVLGQSRLMRSMAGLVYGMGLLLQIVRLPVQLFGPGGDRPGFFRQLFCSQSRNRRSWLVGRFSRGLALRSFT